MNDGGLENEQNVRTKTEFSGDEDRPFTPMERKQIRDLLQADQRRQWVLSTIKTTAVWVSAVGAAIIILKDYLRGIFSGSVVH